MNRSESISKLAVALLKAQASMGNASKGASNPYFKSSYADLNSIREVVTPALNANGITVLQPTTTLDGRAFVETLLLHESGEFLSSLTEITVAKANDPQAAGSAISYARRYGLQSFLSVGAVDDDGEKAMARGPSPAQQKCEAKAAFKAATAAVSEPPTVPATLPASAVAERLAVTRPEVSAAPVAAPEAVKTPKKTPFNKPGKVATPTPISNGTGDAGGWS
jgi:hypothetical protein